VGVRERAQDGIINEKEEGRRKKEEGRGPREEGRKIIQIF
jgi:hypothetical protein